MLLSPPLDLVRRGLDLQNRGDVDGAIALMATGLDLADHLEWRGDIAILANDLAILCETAGRLPLAIEYARKGLAICPGDLALLYRLVHLLTSTGQLDEARQALENLAEACDSSTDPMRAGWDELLERLRNRLKV